MLADVLNAVTRCEGVTRTVIVCSDKIVLREGDYANIEIIREEEEGLNVALDSIVNYSVRNGADSLLILPCDIPLVQKQDIEQIVRSCTNRGITIVPSKDNLGTNSLMLRPPNVIPIAFGPNSFLSHQNLARSRGVIVKILQIDRISLDIDATKDIGELLAAPVHCNTRDFLLKVGMAERLSRFQSDSGSDK
jgi:2-phospho-L-lactate guanylyltransferase